MRVQREADLAAGLLDKISKTQDKKVARKKWLIQAAFLYAAMDLKQLYLALFLLP